jgi:O-antigen/teichoic acid export membrane protein
MSDMPGDAARADVLDTEAAGPAAIRGGVVRTAGYAAGVLLTVGSAAALFRHLGVDDAGRYVTIISLITIVQGLTDAGLTAIGVREFAVREPANRERFMRHLVGVRILLTLVGVLGAIAFAAVAGYGRTLVLGTAVAGVGLLLTALQSALAVPLQAQLRFGWVTALDFLKQLVTVVTILALVLVGADLLPFFAVTILAGAVTLAATAVVVRRTAPLVPAWSRTDWAELLRDALPFGIATAVGALYFRLTIVVLSLVATAEETGYFGASFRIVDVLLIVPQLIVGAAFPIFARAARDDEQRLAYGVGKVFDATLITGGAVALALVLGAPIAISVVAGPAFDPAIPVLRIQGLALIGSFGAAVFAYALLSRRLHREVLITALAALVVSLSAALALAPSHGAHGGALATLMGETALFLTSGVLLARAGLRPSLSVVPKVAVAFSLAAALLLTDLPAGAQLALGAVVYVCALLVLRAVPEEALEELRRVLRLARRPANQ